MNKKIWIWIGLLIFSQPIFSQQNFIDSFELSLSNKSIENQLMEIVAIPYDKLVANPIQSESLYLKALTKNKELNNQETEADLYNQLSLIYAFLGNYDKRLDCNLKAIKIYEAIGNKNKAGITYSRLGFFMYRRDLEKAKIFMQRGISLLEEVNDLVELNATYDNYGILQEVSGNIDSAIYYYNLALDLKVNQADSIGIPFALGHLSGAYLIKKEFEKSKKYLDESFAIRKKRNDVYGVAECLMLYAGFYSTQGKNKQAIPYLLDCYNITKEKNYGHMGQHILLQLADCYEKMGDFASALIYQKLYIELKDELINESTNNKIAQLEIQYDTEKKETENKLLQSENKLSIKTIKQQKTVTIFIIIGLVIVSVLAFVIFKGLKKQRKANVIIFEQKLLVEEKHKEIRDSINYAERIQKALLANSKILDENISNHFILFKPKDIVSGDFYWATKLVNDHFVVVTADSTGHGVPGAIMSILNIACLKEVVSKGFVSPETILDQTRKLIIENLRNDGSPEGGQDGMDGSLLSFDFKNNVVYCASANNPIWIIRENELIEIKGDRMSVGKHANDKFPFTLHTQNLQKGDVVYTLTDGYADQFGGVNGKKFKHKQLKELLVSISPNSMEMQKQILDTVFNQWKGSFDQVDDVCIMGVRI